MGPLHPPTGLLVVIVLVPVGAVALLAAGAIASVGAIASSACWWTRQIMSNSCRTLDE